jgi:hypothetical protein
MGNILSLTKEPTGTSCKITVQTDLPAQSEFILKTSDGLQDQLFQHLNFSTFHIFNIATFNSAPLISGQTYYFDLSIKFEDNSIQQILSPPSGTNGSFTTSAASTTVILTTPPPTPPPGASVYPTVNFYSLLPPAAAVGSIYLVLGQEGAEPSRKFAGLYQQTVSGYIYLGLPDTAMGGGYALLLNNNTINQNFTIPAGKNAISAGPITVTPGNTVTVPPGSTWVIV